MQPGPQRTVGVEKEGFELVGGLGAGLDRAAPSEQQQPQLADEPAPVLGIALASPAAASLEQSLTMAFGQHPDAEIITSFPGLGTVLGARILAEIGDDRARFATARGLQAFVGTAPITRASGRKIIVTRRVVRSKRLGQAAYLWALPMIAHSSKAHAHFTARREHGDSYSADATSPTTASACSTTACGPTSSTTRPRHSPASAPPLANPRHPGPSRDRGARPPGARRPQRADRDLFRASGWPGLSKDRGTIRLTTSGMRCLLSLSLAHDGTRPAQAK